MNSVRGDSLQGGQNSLPHREENVLAIEYSEVNDYLQPNLSKLNGIIEEQIELFMYLETEFHGGGGAKVFLLSQA